MEDEIKRNGGLDIVIALEILRLKKYKIIGVYEELPQLKFSLFQHKYLTIETAIKGKV